MSFSQSLQFKNLTPVGGQFLRGFNYNNDFGIPDKFYNNLTQINLYRLSTDQIATDPGQTQVWYDYQGVTKPIIITEYGVSKYRPTSNVYDEANQATQLTRIVAGLEKLPIVLGAYNFKFDETYGLNVNTNLSYGVAEQQPATPQPRTKTQGWTSLVNYSLVNPV